jgi:competence protein ComEA
MVQLASRPIPPVSATPVAAPSVVGSEAVVGLGQPRVGSRMPGLVRLPITQSAEPGRRKQLFVIAGISLAAIAIVVGLIAAATGRTGAAGQPAIVEQALPLAKPGSPAAGSAARSGAEPGVGSGVVSQAGVGQTLRPAAVPTTLVPVPPTTISAVVVHAAGALRNPGVYVMPTGSRAADVVFAAGGLSAEADQDRINLALPVTDGARVYVPRRGVPVPLVAPDFVGGGTDSSGQASGGSTAPTTMGLIDINSATTEQLDSLPGVGPATAAAIVEHRTKIGRFTSLTQLMDVPGIGEAKLAAMRKRLSVSK